MSPSWRFSCCSESKLEIQLLFEDDPPLFNPYGIIAVNPVRHPDINYAGAIKLIKWMTSPPVQKMIGEFKIKGQQLFVPSAGNAS
jgi:tungstate transport system substrate-binding protein